MESQGIHGREEQPIQKHRYHKEFRGLSRSIAGSYRQLSPFRRMYTKLVKEYVGPMYGDNEGGIKYLNKMQQTVDAYMTLLAANRPRVSMSSAHIELGGFANHFESGINNLIGEIRIEEKIRAWVMDAYFCMGVMKLHMAESALVTLENDISMDPGSPFCSVIPLDDFVYDITAKDLNSSKYTADMYQIPFADIQEGIESGLYDERFASKLKESSSEPVQGRTDEIMRSGNTDADAFMPMIDLCDVWIPSHGKIYTFPVQDRRNFTITPDPIAVMEWKGPEVGPYVLLSFNGVPGSVMPTSPASHQVFLDQLINNLMRKSARQAKRQKDNPVYEPGEGAETMRRLLSSEDGEPIASTNPKSVSLIKQGGVDASNMAFLSNIIEMYDSYAGNLTAMLGLGAQADTVGQEQMIHSAGSKRGAQMQYRVLEATRRVIEGLGSMLWRDEFKHISGVIDIGGGPDNLIQSDWKPGDREGSFEDYSFDINVHSMQSQPPAKKAEAILSLLNQVYMPAGAMIQQGNSPIDFAELTDILADLLNLPRLRNILQPIMEGRADALSPPQAGKPSQTTRNYVRKSVATGGTPQNRSHLNQQAWLGRTMSEQQTGTMNQSQAG